MTINHVIVGAIELSKSVEFYCDFLGFEPSTETSGPKHGQVLDHEECELLVMPFPETSLPNPAHLAFEVKTLQEFESLLSKAEAMNLTPRSLPPKDSERGPGEFAKRGRSYRNFYVTDPSGIALEILVRNQPLESPEEIFS